MLPYGKGSTTCKYLCTHLFNGSHDLAGWSTQSRSVVVDLDSLSILWETTGERAKRHSCLPADYCHISHTAHSISPWPNTTNKIPIQFANYSVQACAACQQSVTFLTLYLSLVLLLEYQDTLTAGTQATPTSPAHHLLVLATSQQIISNIWRAQNNSITHEHNTYFTSTSKVLMCYLENHNMF